MNLETKTSRSRLEAQKKPYWLRLNAGLALGYRRTASGSGTWSIRRSDGISGTKRKQGKRPSNIIKRLAVADDIAAANGKDIMSFSEARDAALRIGRGEPATEQPKAVLALSDALDRYSSDLETRGGDKLNVTRIRKHLPATMTKRPIALLTAEELRGWRDRLAKKLKPASVNRTARGLKAALNLCADTDRTLDRHAWTVGLALIPNAETSENVILPPAAVAALVAAARRQTVEFGNLVQLAAETGARCSQLARAQIQDLLGERLNVPVSRKGRGVKEVRSRPVPITARLAARLRIAAGDRPATDPLLLRPDGQPWRHTDERERFKDAAKDAGQAGVTMYALRHTSIVRQILAGVPLRLVAVAHDTSVQQIEKNYSRYIDAFASDAAIRATLPDLESTTSDNVVALR